MTWHVEYTSAARKELRKMGRVNAARILDWMDKHIDGCEDPRVTGKGLTANRCLSSNKSACRHQLI